VDGVEDLKHLRDLAALEGYARLSDLDALLTLAQALPTEHHAALLEVARAVYSAERSATAFAVEPLTGFVALVAHPGLQTATFRALDSSMDALLTHLEDLHRIGGAHPLETAIQSALQAIKDALFGRALNVAERSRLRGFYEREKLLRRW
jgi:hypothetical protein